MKVQIADLQTTMISFRELFQRQKSNYLFDITRKNNSEYFLIVAPEHCCYVKSKRHWMVFGNKSFFMKFKIKSILKPPAFCLSSPIFINTEKVPTLPNLALKALEIVSASKQKFYIFNQKEMKLTKNPDCSPFRYNSLENSILSFFLEKKYKVMLHLIVPFQRYQIYWLR